MEKTTNIIPSYEIVTRTDDKQDDPGFGLGILTGLGIGLVILIVVISIFCVIIKRRKSKAHYNVKGTEDRPLNIQDDTAAKENEIQQNGRGILKDGYSPDVELGSDQKDKTGRSDSEDDTEDMLAIPPDLQARRMSSRTSSLDDSTTDVDLRPSSTCGTLPVDPDQGEIDPGYAVLLKDEDIQLPPAITVSCVDT